MTDADFTIEQVAVVFATTVQMEDLLRKSRTSRGSPSLAGLLDYSAPRVTGGLLGALAQ